MGFITNQWLKGEPERDRSYSPVEGKVSGHSLPWKNHDVVFDIRIERPDGARQIMHLTQGEIDKLLPSVMECGEQSIRLEAALDILADLTDTELLQFLTRLLSKRAS